MQHIPPGYVRILAKIDEIGRATYGDACAAIRLPSEESD